MWSSILTVSALLPILTQCQQVTYHIGNIYSDLEGRWNSLAVLQLAEMDLRKNNVIGDNITFVYHQRNFSTDNEAGAGVSASNMSCESNIDVFIGPYLGTSMGYLLPFATLTDDSVVGYVSTLDSLSDKTRYPTFARISNSQTSFGKAVLKFLQYHNWTSIALISTPSCQPTIDGINTGIAGSNITVVYQYIFSSYPLITNSEMVSVLTALGSSARISIVCFTMNPWDSRPFMVAAMRHNMTDSSFVYILPYPAKTTDIQYLPWQVPNLPFVTNSSISDNDAKNAFLFSFVIEPLGSDQNSTTKANAEIDRFAKQQPYIGYGINDEINVVTVYRPTLYNAMYLYGVALNACLSFGIPEFTRSGRLMFTCFKHQIVTGLTGVITTDENADATSVYAAKSFDVDGNYSNIYEIHATPHLCSADEKRSHTWSVVLSFPSTNGIDRSSYSFKKTLCPEFIAIVGTDVWGTPNNLPPPAVPPCGFDGSLCVNTTNYGLIAAVLATCALLAIVLFGYCSYRRKKLKRLEMMSFTWKLPRKEIQFLTEKQPALGSKAGSKSGSFIGSLLSMGLQPVDGGLIEAELLKNGLYITGRYRNDWVFVRAVMMIKQMEMKEEELLILRKIFETNHENLNRFVGICMDSRKDILIVWNHCGKGKLKNLLYDTDIELDYAFKSSILQDITKGLDYLHSNSYLNYHGNLSSTTCLITSRWVVVLSDFGMNKLLNPKFADGTLRKTFNETEEVRFGGFQNDVAVGSKEQDIYDFAEILYEVITREQMPIITSDSVEILQKVADSGPFLEDKSKIGNYTTPIIQLFKECRANAPSLRPTLMTLKTVVQSCSHNMKNLLDHMFVRMEKYANSLEGIVSERTALLQEERMRADSLLYQMLPRTVADALKRGESVRPEMYDAATIYFSDIVGFTTICSDSSPIQVVDMLNSLYNQFDAIINAHDCYKVETIGDAYLVVSGVPKRNGDKHVTEVCDMSIEIMDFVSKKFVIPHMRDRTMSIRIGVHSGSVAAGVIGLSMPRYCLFGDSVNVASRMESHGIPLKIHLSWSTAALLQSLPHYHVSPRGETFIKGKGICLTYWLDNKKEQQVQYQENTPQQSYNNLIKVIYSTTISAGRSAITG